MKQSNSACILLTVLVLVLAGREVQRTFLPSSITPLRGVSANELADFFDIDAWSFTLPQEITSERVSIGINWYRLDEWNDEEGELIQTGGTSTLHVDAGEEIRLLLQKTETDLYKEFFSGPSWASHGGTFNPYKDRENVGWSTDPSAGWDENLITFNSNPSAESGQAPEYWALRASFKEITPEED